jgi:hypothetical protein
MFRPTCGNYACVLSLFAHKAAGAAKHPAFPAPSLIEGRQSLRQSPGAISSVAGMRRRVIESANAVIRKQGKLSCPDLIGSSPLRTPRGVIASVSEAIQPFRDSQGGPQASVLGNYKLDTKGNSSFSAAPDSVYCRSASSAVVWHHRAKRRPNEVSAC